MSKSLARSSGASSAPDSPNACLARRCGRTASNGSRFQPASTMRIAGCRAPPQWARRPLVDFHVRPSSEAPPRPLSGDLAAGAGLRDSTRSWQCLSLQRLIPTNPQPPRPCTPIHRARRGLAAAGHPGERTPGAGTQRGLGTIRVGSTHSSCHRCPGPLARYLPRAHTLMAPSSRQTCHSTDGQRNAAVLSDRGRDRRKHGRVRQLGSALRWTRSKQLRPALSAGFRLHADSPRIAPGRRRLLA